MTKVEEIFSNVQNIIKDVLDVNEVDVKMTTSADDIDEWDSLSHINIITAIEKEFKIKFTLSELSQLGNVSDTVNLIIKKLN